MRFGSIYAPVRRHYKHVTRRVKFFYNLQIDLYKIWAVNYLDMDCTYHEDPIEPDEQGLKFHSFQGTEEDISSAFEDYEDDQGKYMRN